MTQDNENREVLQEESTFVDKYVASSLYPEEESKHAALKITLYVLSFLVFAVLNPLVVSVPALEFLMPVRGIFSIIQLMLSILIVQSLNKKGFYAVLVMSVLQIIASIVVMIRFSDNFALNGLVTTILSLIIVGIILAYNRRVEQEIER
ncbi:MAG: hypothetical protein IKZ74_07080, partial [Clostridiales bacterium]|nr:hypothetical protein [Clostridiales bacterium]